MNRTNKGFVVSAVLYPLLILFLALIMGLLSMSDTRKRILDKMKLEISDSVFDEATCSCDTILNKLNYLIKNGVGGGGGSYSQNTLGLSVTAYETPSEMPNVGNNEGDIAVITATEITSYYVSQSSPNTPKEGMVWIVMSKVAGYNILSDYSNIPISYAVQYENEKWILKKSYVYAANKWKELNYISGDDYTYKFDYTGEYEEFVIQYTGTYQIELWGASGGQYNASYPGGKGAYTSGKIYLTAGEKLYIYVGKGGTGGINATWSSWNGGGQAGSTASTYGSATGGGATDVRLAPTSSKTTWNESTSLRSRIMVAAGGGGGYYYNNGTYVGKGGAGGGLIGYTGTTNYQFAGTGGTQTAGGTHNASFGIGGFNVNGGSYSGGGGGWYGGGGGSHVDGSGGGSSYISGHAGCNSVDTSGYHIGSAVSHTGKYFTNTKMIDGQGYEWETLKGAYIGMPNYDGTNTMIGNSGNGYAKITFESFEYIDDEEIESIGDNIEKLWTFPYMGYYQQFNIPKSGNYKIELWGAQGGNYSASYPGGKGSYTSGEIYLTKNEKLYIYVGEVGKGGINATWTSWNGGGQAYSSSSPYGSASGGGATDIRLTSTSSTTTWNDISSLRSRIMVAAGGGGGYIYNNGSYVGTGGAGGGLLGYDGTTNFQKAGTGATQISGGTYNAGFGIGGFNTSVGAYSGGGAGWYGGGGGYHVDGAGGGSSYISGHAGCIAINQNGTPKTDIYSEISDSISYTGFKFANTKMIDGRGYVWTDKIGGLIYTPTYDSLSTMTGNSGNGYAKITFID